MVHAMDESYAAIIGVFLDEARDKIVGNKLTSVMARATEFVDLVDDRFSDLRKFLLASHDGQSALFAAQSLSHIVQFAHAAGENSPKAFLEAVETYRSFNHRKLAAAGVEGRTKKRAKEREAVSAEAQAQALKHPDWSAHRIAHLKSVMEAAGEGVPVKTIEYWVAKALKTTVTRPI